MAEILGIGTTDFPMARMSDDHFTRVLRQALDTDKVKPELRDPANWPEGMREEWGDDQGRTSARAAREYLTGQFSKLTSALDDFRPDFILVWSKDAGESLKNFSRPKFWVQAHDAVDIKPYTQFGAKDNYFGEDPDKVVTVKGHPEGAGHLIKGLQQAGFDPAYSTEPFHQGGLAHTFQGVITHLDWERREYKTPVVPVSIDPFGSRLRVPEGMSPRTADDILPLTSQRAFDLGRATARVLRDSPWRVALVAGTGWSHTQNTSWEHSWVHPDQEADVRRHEEWAANKFATWHDWSFDDMEEHGQWEHLCWIALAGAMTELGAKIAYSDLRLQWTPPSEWVNSIFTVA